MPSYHDGPAFAEPPFHDDYIVPSLEEILNQTDEKSDWVWELDEYLKDITTGHVLLRLARDHWDDEAELGRQIKELFREAYQDVG